MKTTALKIFAFLCLISPVMAQPASVDSIKELLVVTESKKLLDGMFPQIDALIKSTMSQAVAGKNLTEEQQRELEKTFPKITAEIMQAMREELSWEKLEPMYLEIYQKSFAQEEVDGMLSFYKSPAGVAVIKKMPVVMQETMMAMQQRMGPMIARIEKAVEEAVAESEKEEK